MRVAVFVALFAVASALTSAPWSRRRFETWPNGATLKNCRNTLYNSDAQVCCNGMLYDQEYVSFTGANKVKFTCCGTSTSLTTINYDANGAEQSLCCGDSYYTTQTGKSCCGNSYEDLTDKTCCEGSIVSTTGFTTPACCAGTVIENSFSGDFACCPTDFKVENNGYEYNSNTGYTNGGYSIGYPIVVTSGTAYNTTAQACCSGALSTRQGLAGTSTNNWGCCAGTYTNWDKNTQFRCGQDLGESGTTTTVSFVAALDGRTCKIYNKKDNILCKGHKKTCDLKFDNSFSCNDCTATIGKGSGYSPLCQTRFNGDGSSAATVSASLAVVVAAFAALFL